MLFFDTLSAGQQGFAALFVIAAGAAIGVAAVIFLVARKRLVPCGKYNKVADHAAQMIKEIEMIAHSCGIAEPRQLHRHNVRMAQPNGRSAPTVRLDPTPETSA